MSQVTKREAICRISKQQSMYRGKWGRTCTVDKNCHTTCCLDDWTHVTHSSYEILTESLNWSSFGTAAAFGGRSARSGGLQTCTVGNFVQITNVQKYCLELVRFAGIPGGFHAWRGQQMWDAYKDQEVHGAYVALTEAIHAVSDCARGVQKTVQNVKVKVPGYIWGAGPLPIMCAGWLTA